MKDLPEWIIANIVRKLSSEIFRNVNEIQNAFRRVRKRILFSFLNREVGKFSSWVNKRRRKCKVGGQFEIEKM